MQAEVEEKIKAEKNNIIDLAMYSIWSANQNVDISFMEDEAEALLSKWRARWEEERELQSITASGAIASNEDGGEVSSKAAQRNFAIEIGALIVEEARETTILEVPQQCCSH